MVKVIATSKGFFGGRIIDVGEGFECPDDLWDDEKKRPQWARLPTTETAVAALAGAQTSGAENQPPASSGAVASSGPVEVPADWQTLHHSKRKALAKQISGSAVADLAVADNIIAAHVEATKPEVFGDAPKPQTVVEAQKEIGTIQPDWEAPDAAKQVAD